MDTAQLKKSNIPAVLFAEIKTRLLATKESQTIYIWDLSADEQEYCYVVCRLSDKKPDIVTAPTLGPPRYPRAADATRASYNAAYDAANAR